VKTLLISTSSLWNCGDDFIREGVMETLDIRDDVRTLWWNRGFGIGENYANDLKLNLSHADYVVIAGTPKWIFNNERIYRHCLRKKIPLALIGVGTRDLIGAKQTELMQAVAKSGLCEIALARDHAAYETLGELGFAGAEKILDPCFFVPPLNTPPGQLNIFAWRAQFSLDGDPRLPLRHPIYVAKKLLAKEGAGGVSRPQRRRNYDTAACNIFERMAEPKRVVVHDNREIADAERLFGADRVFYSTDYREIFKQYAAARYVIGSRIHGTIPALLHGAPLDLIYTTAKASVVTDAIALIGARCPGLADAVRLWNYEFDAVPDWPLPRENFARVDLVQLHAAIAEEKQRVRELLRRTPVLSNYLREM
jgi:Polysaccharide pyruvyl transferase